MKLLTEKKETEKEQKKKRKTENVQTSLPTLPRRDRSESPRGGI